MIQHSADSTGISSSQYRNTSVQTLMPNFITATSGLALFLAYAGFVNVADAHPDDAAPKGIPIIKAGADMEVARLESGALLVEDFESNEIDLKRWRIWQMDPDKTTMAVKDGRFVIDAKGQVAHNGLWSLSPPKYKDVTLVAQFDIQSEGPDSHELLLHLCGGDMPRSPDHWFEIAQRDLNVNQARFSTYAATARGDFNQGDRFVELKRPVNGKSSYRDTGFLAKVTLNGATNRCVAEVRDSAGKWQSLVDPVPLHLRTTHCELKIRGGTAGSKSTGWFDDARIYPRAESHSVLVRLQMADGTPIYHRGESGNEWPPTIQVAGNEERKLEDLSVELWTADGLTKVVAVQSPNLGDYMLPLTEAPWDVYPVAAIIRVTLEGQILGKAKIKRDGLTGLYPDDVYAVRFQ